MTGSRATPSRPVLFFVNLRSNLVIFLNPAHTPPPPSTVPRPPPRPVAPPPRLARPITPPHPPLILARGGRHLTFAPANRLSPTFRSITPPPPCLLHQPATTARLAATASSLPFVRPPDMESPKPRTLTPASSSLSTTAILMGRWPWRAHGSWGAWVCVSSGM